MERNIPALLDESARTIHVKYQHEGKDGDSSEYPSYTYVTNIKDIKAGDYVVVPTAPRSKLITGSGPRLSVALVVLVDDDVNIEPNSDMQYKWAIQRIDVDSYNALMARNKAIEDHVNSAYKSNIPQSFANTVLGLALGDEGQSTLKLLLKGTQS